MHEMGWDENDGRESLNLVLSFAGDSKSPSSAFWDIRAAMEETVDGALDEFDGQITFSLYLLAMTGRSGVTEKGGKKKGKEKGKKENVVALHGILLRPAVTVTPGIYKYAESHYD